MGKENVLREQLQVLSREDLIACIVGETAVSAALAKRREKNQANIKALIDQNYFLDCRLEALKNQPNRAGTCQELMRQYRLNIQRLKRLQGQNSEIERVMRKEAV